MSIRFTDSYVRTVRLGKDESRKEVSDAMVRGLNLRITQASDDELQRVWMVRYCPKGKKQRRAVIGTYRLVNGEQRGMPLEAARSRALDIGIAARFGRDLLEEEEQGRKAAQAEAKVAAVPRLEPVLRQYVEEGMRGRAATHIKQTIRMYERHVFPTLGATQLPDLEPHMIHKVVQAVAKKAGLCRCGP